MRVQPSKALLKRISVNGRLVLSFVIGLMFVSYNVTVFALADTFASEQKLTLKAAQQNIDNRKFKLAVQLADQVLDKTPMQTAAQFIRAQALSQLGNMAEAIKIYQSILRSKTSQNHPEAYNNLATLYAQQGKFDLARQTLENGIATNEQYKTLHENLSSIYVEMARGAYSKALKLGVQAKAVQLKTLSYKAIQREIVEPPQQIVLAQSKTDIVQVVSNKKDIEEKKSKMPALALLNKIAKPVKTKPLATKISDARAAVIKKQSETLIKEKMSVKQISNIDKDKLITTLHGWAAAWSAQAVDLYLSFYADDFKPDKLSKKVWAVQRRIRLNKPRWVNVRLKDFSIKVKPSQNNQVVVQLVQDYRADNYHDKTKKKFIMKSTIDGWRILSEKSLAVIR